MNLVILAAFIAVCSAAKLDRSYLPPPSAASAGGNSASLQTPLTKSSDGAPSVVLPTGSYTNNFQGIIVDAAAPGTRASSDSNQSGLGAPRDNYGSSNSKVGEAAFRGTVAGFRTPPSFGGNGQNVIKPERPQATKDRNSNVISYANDVSLDNYSYGFETDNGIAVGENGVANNGIQAQGGYSYQGDDGEVYKVTYTADEGGYQPHGNHLPTPPPIPKEILKSLEQNAKDEAAGVVDDGSYDAQKYNAEGGYTHNDGSQYNGPQSPSKRPDAGSSGSFINQNSQAFGKPSLGLFEAQSSHSNFNGQSIHFSGSQSGFAYGSNQNAGSQDKESSQTFGGSQHIPSGDGSGSLTAQFGTQGSFGTSSSSSLHGSQNNQGSGQFEAQKNPQSSTPQFGTQAIFGSQSTQTGFLSQSGTQSTKPTFGQSVSSPVSNIQGAQFGNQVLRPQGSFSQAQNTQTSGQHQFIQGLPELSQSQDSSKPSYNTFGTTKPSISGQISSNIGSSGSSNYNLFPNSPNLFGAGYLPPFNKPQTTKDTSQEQNQVDQSSLSSIPSGQIQGFPQTSSASSFASVGQSGFESQPIIAENSLQSHSPSKPNQFNYNSPASSNTLQSSSQNSDTNLIASSPTVLSQSKPSSIPDIELTTPLEPHEKPAFSQGSFFNSQTTSSFGNFGSKPQNNQAGSQFSSQSNSGSQESTQSLSPSFPTSVPQKIPQISVSPTLPSSTPATFSAQQGSFSQTSFTQNQQQNSYYSTQKPFSQGPDNSYYYNQPSKPFNTPGFRPHSSRFPSAPSYQSNNGIASSQNNQFSNQQGGLTDSTIFPSTTSFNSVAPTSSSEFAQTHGGSYNNGGITQAAASPFPSVSPTTSTQFSSAPTGQFGSKPNFSQTSTLQALQTNKPTIPQQPAISTFPSKPASSFGQKPSTSFTQNQGQFSQSPTDRPFTQQYQGTIYQYNKPAVTLPPPAHTGSSLSQNVPNASAKPQIGQQFNINMPKPQFGSQQTHYVTQNTFEPQTLQTSLNLGNRPQFASQLFSKPFGNLPPLDPNFGQNTQTTIKPSTGSITASQFGQGSYQSYKPFGSSQSSSQFGQNTQTSIGSQNLANKQPSKPIGSVNTHFGQTVQSQGSYNSGLSNLQNTQSSQSNEQSFKPFGTTGSTQTFGSSVSAQGVSTIPQFGAQSQTQFTQQHSFGSTQANSQPALGPEATASAQPSSSPIHGSPDSMKPPFGQNLTQGNKPSGSFGQAFQGSFHLSTPKPQFGTQIGQNPNTTPVQSSSSTGQNSNSLGTSQTSQFKPFGSSVQSQIKPQSQGSQTGSIAGSASFGVQPGTTNSQKDSSVPNSGSIASQTGTSQGALSSPCCQGSSGSAITALNLSKPSQAFAQTQSQFSGSHGSQFSASSVAGKGEEFGGPREPPRFDATGYHY